MVTVGEQHAQDAISRLPESLGRVSGFLELISMDLGALRAATDANGDAMRDLAEAVYTLVHLLIAQKAGEQPSLDHINAATRMWLAERDQPQTPKEENP